MLQVTQSIMKDLMKRIPRKESFYYRFRTLQKIEIYTNFSQNFRSVTFADISIKMLLILILMMKKDLHLILGFRGNYKKMDSSIFALIYRDRIGFIQKVFSDGNVKSERGNVGNAQITGIESLFDFDINEILFKNEDVDFNIFFNYSYIESKYLKSNEVGITGKEVEFVPKNNFKTGLKFGYKDFAINFQYSYLSSQFTDSSNAISGNLSGVIGQIPSYEISDLSMSYLRNIKFEAGVNNLFDETYFTRRATGYPGPGIIPSPPRNSYITRNQTMSKSLNNEIIIYDGICVLCNYFIQFILKKDKKAHFKVTNLQSDFTKTKYPEILAVDSVAVILENGKILQKSKAVYYILQKIKVLLLVRILIYVFPTFFSNIIYDFIALIRYKLFGKYSYCPVLKGDLKNRIIE